MATKKKKDSEKKPKTYKKKKKSTVTAKKKKPEYSGPAVNMTIDPSNFTSEFNQLVVRLKNELGKQRVPFYIDNISFRFALSLWYWLISHSMLAGTKKFKVFLIGFSNTVFPFILARAVQNIDIYVADNEFFGNSFFGNSYFELANSALGTEKIVKTIGHLEAGYIEDEEFDRVIVQTEDVNSLKEISRIVKRDGLIGIAFPRRLANDFIKAGKNNGLELEYNQEYINNKEAKTGVLFFMKP